MTFINQIFNFNQVEMLKTEYTDLFEHEIIKIFKWCYQFLQSKKWELNASQNGQYDDHSKAEVS